MAEAFEYAVRKDVRNNPIVREVDAERQTEMWRTAALWTLPLLAVMFWTWQHFEIVRHGYRLEEVARERTVEEDAGQHLRLDIATLRAPDRIEALARKQSLVTPRREDAVVIERVMAAEPPAKSVVARR
jgi:hypothetical protein